MRGVHDSMHRLRAEQPKDYNAVLTNGIGSSAITGNSNRSLTPVSCPKSMYVRKLLLES